MSKKMQELLCSLNICDKSSIEQFFPQVRDRDDVAVLKCRKSGVIFLSRSDHMEKSHYENCADLKYWGGLDRKTALMNTAVDDQRRSDQFGEVVSGKIWLDVGTGLDLEGFWTYCLRAHPRPLLWNHRLGRGNVCESSDIRSIGTLMTYLIRPSRPYRSSMSWSILRSRYKL